VSGTVRCSSFAPVVLDDEEALFAQMPDKVIDGAGVV
jgi:hypothetical protein